MKGTSPLFNAFLTVMVLAAFAVLPASADDNDPGDYEPTGLENDPALVNQVVNNDGSINYDGMTDLGIVTQEAAWMDAIPFSDGVATYHQYLSPDGSLVVVPTALTTLGLQMNSGIYEYGLPDGYYNPNGELGTFLFSDLASNKGYRTTLLEGGLDIYLPTEYYTSTGFAINNPSGPSASLDERQILFDTLADYKGIAKDDIVAQIVMSMISNWDILVAGYTDSNGILTNLNSTILIYTDCAESPVGCTREYMAANSAVTPPAAVIVDPPACAAPYTTSGAITVTGGPGAGDGGKLAPLHPVVVGQDPQRRGVDVQAQVLVPLITYHYFEAVRHEEIICMSGPANPDNTGCPGPASRYANRAAWTRTAIGNPRNYEQVHVYFECIEHTRVYTDQVSAVTISLSLTEASRQWILTSLEQAYPGAHLLHPSFSFRYPGPGSLAGSGVTWTQVVPNIPVADPGWWAVTVFVLTTGTPVSGARYATVGLGVFLDELVRVTLTSGIQP